MESARLALASSPQPGCGRGRGWYAGLLVGEAAPKAWRGRFFEDFEVGDVYRSRIGRTISETDNTWITALTMNTKQVHFNAEFAARTRFGRPLVTAA